MMNFLIACYPKKSLKKYCIVHILIEIEVKIKVFDNCAWIVKLKYEFCVTKGAESGITS